MRECLNRVEQVFALCHDSDLACICTAVRDVGTLCYKDCPHTVLVDYVETYTDEQCKSLGAFAMDAVRFSGDSGFQHRDNAFPFPFPGDDGDTDSLFDSGDDFGLDDSETWNDQVPEEHFSPVPEIDYTSPEISDDGNGDKETDASFTDPSYDREIEDPAEKHEYDEDSFFYDGPSPNYGFYHESDGPLRYAPPEYGYYRDAFDSRYPHDRPSLDSTYSRNGFERDALRRISPDEFHGYGPQQYYHALPSNNYEQYYDEEDDNENDNSSSSGPILKLREKLRRRLGWVSASSQGESSSDDLNMLLAQEAVMDAKDYRRGSEATVPLSSKNFDTPVDSKAKSMSFLADQVPYNLESDIEEIYEPLDESDVLGSTEEQFADPIDLSEQADLDSEDLDYSASEIEETGNDEDGSFKLQEDSESDDTMLQEVAEEPIATPNDIESEENEDEMTDYLEFSDSESTPGVSDEQEMPEDLDTEKSDSSNYEETYNSDNHDLDISDSMSDPLELDTLLEVDVDAEVDDLDDDNTESTVYDAEDHPDNEDNEDNSLDDSNDSDEGDSENVPTSQSQTGTADVGEPTKVGTPSYSQTSPFISSHTFGSHQLDIEIAVETAAVSNSPNLPSSVEYYPRPGMTTQAPDPAAGSEGVSKEEQEMSSMKSMLSSQRREKAQESARLEMLQKEKEQRESENEQELHKQVSDEVTKEKDDSEENQKAESFFKNKLSMKDHSSSGGKLNVLAPLLIVSSGSLFLWLGGVSEFAIGGYVVITGAVALNSFGF